jgi:hypothetical protein
MKRNLIILLLIFCFLISQAQENGVLLNGGYVFTTMKNVKGNAKGYRINGLYEFTPDDGNFAHGLSIGFIRTSASTMIGTQEADYDLKHFPVCYEPAFFFLKSSFRGFIKAAIGLHYSEYQVTTSTSDKDTWDWGFYGGLSGGLMET